MRTDPNKSVGFTESRDWQNQRYDHKLIYPDPTGRFKYRVNSFSGNEPNRLFMRSGDSFVDVSPISGVDHKGDGRGFALLDYDKDGWQDIALISTNAPRLQIFRNRMAEYHPQNKSLRILLVGGQRDSSINPSRSNRDGVGAKIFVYRKSGNKSLTHRQLGEGNVAQNSSWIWLAHPENDPITKLQVIWPSGKQSQIEIDGKASELTINEPIVAGPVQ